MGKLNMRAGGASLLALAAMAAAGAARAQTSEGTPAGLNTTLPVPRVIRGAPFTSFTVFGDSLSDDGNVALLTGLPNLTGTSAFQKFTTNPANVTVEDVAAGLGLALAPSRLGGSDYAYGGAGVNDDTPGSSPPSIPLISTQVTAYLATPGRRLDPTGLYSVLGGGNDVFYHAAASIAGQLAAQAIARLPAAQQAAFTPAINAAAAASGGVRAVETPAEALAALAAAGTQEAALAGQLQAAGARYVLLLNLPDVGAIPSSQASNATLPGASAQITALTNAFNTALEAGAARIGPGIVPINFNLFNAEVRANPAAFGLTNITTPACTTSSSITCTQNTLVSSTAPQTYAFADGVHPTGPQYAAVGDLILAELAAPAYISLLAEAPLAFSDAQRLRLTDELAIDSTDPQARSRVFASFDYQSQRFDGQGLSSRLNNDGGSVTVGGDYVLSPSLSGGLAFTYGNSFDRFGAAAGKFRVEDYLGSVFGQYVYRRAGYINASVGYGGLDYGDIQRQFALGVAQRVEHAQTGGRDFTANVTAGWWFGLDGVYQSLKVGPYAGFHYEHVRVDAFREAGADSTAQTFGAQTREREVGEFGGRAQATVRLPYVTLSPYVQAAFDYDGRADRRAVASGLVTEPGVFSVPGFDPASTWGTVEAGVNARVNDRVSLFASYNGRFSDDSQRLHAANVGVKYSF